MSLKEIEEEIAELRKEIKETPPHEQGMLTARLANLSNRYREMVSPKKKHDTTPPHEEDQTEE